MLRKRIISAVLSATLVAQPLTTYAADVITVPTDAQATVIVDGSDDGQQEQIETETAAAAEVQTGYWFSDSMQLMLYDDGTYSMLEGDIYQSGNWIKGTGGVTLQYNGGERVVMLDGSGLAHSDGTIVWQLPTLVITAGDTVQPPSLGSGFTVSGGELDTSQTGDFNVQYTVTDEAIGKQFSLARTVIIQEVSVQVGRPVVDYGPATDPEPETQEQEQPTTETQGQVQPETQAATEPVVIGGEHADQSAEEITTPGYPVDEQTDGSGFSKVFTVMTPGGTMTVSNSTGQLLATVEYGQSYTIDTVQNANDGIDDVTIELIAADGYVVDGLEHLATAGDVKAAAWCPSMIGTKTFNRGAYLTQLASDEEYNAYFCQDGDFQYVDPNEFSLFAVSSLDSAEVGTQFSGRATLTSISSPAGHTYNGSGVISCTSGELAGHNFTMSTCETGHSGAIPLAGQTGSYTATVKSIDRKNGSISLFIYWANDSTPIGNYQSLSTSTSISHSFQGEIGVNKTSASADARVTNSAYYSLANAEFTLYKNYDSKTGKVSGAVGKITTDANGQAVKKLIVDAGTYYMKETKAPKGFLLNETVFTINAEAGGSISRTVQEEPKYGQIKINKTNKSTSKPDKRLEGTKFGVYRDAKCTDKVDTITIDPTGYGESHVKYFLGVTYYVKEISTSEYFTLNKTVQKVKITDDGTKIPSKTLKFTNSERHTGLALIKYDTHTGSTTTTSDEYSFKGAQYTVYSDEKCTKKVGVITLDEDGYGELDGLKTDTDYWFRETKAPANYELNSEIRHAHLDNPNDVTEYDVADTPKPTHFTILKVNADTDQPDARLAGTVFGIYSDYNCTTLIEQVTAGADGLATTSDQYWLGVTYYVKELKSTESWMPLDGVQAVEPTDAVKIPQVKFRNRYETKKISLQKRPAALTPVTNLTGAHYTIYSDSNCTQVVDVMITDKDGKATSKDLPLGIYYVKETQAPDGYKLDEEIHKVDISKSSYDDGYFELDVADPSYFGLITVEKYDLDTNSATPANPNYSLDGAIYTVYSDSSCTTPAVAAYGENTITIKNAFGASGWFAEGTYWVKETTAPVGYDLDTHIYQVTTTGGAAAKIESHDPIKRGAIAIEKHDAVTGSTASATDAYSMDGAEYTIFSDEACSNALKTVTIQDGKASTDKEFILGTYYVKETKAPQYYKADTNVYKVDVNADNCDAVPVVVSTDNPERARIAIQKSDAETGEFKPLVQTLSFKDAAFGIYTDRECTDLVQQLTTDENGYAISDELLMRDYYVKEITAPTGYTLNSTIFTVTAAELKQNSERTVKVVVPDRIIRANITLMKHISEDTGSIIQMPGNDLKGIKFVFTYVADESIKFSLSDEENTIVTDEYGHATTADLEKYPYGTLIYGTWRISEVLPNGALEPIKDIELPVKEDGVDYPYVVNNDRVTSYLQIIKKDKETGNNIPISGVTFKIKTEANEYVKMWDYKAGAYVDQFSTDDSGTIRLPGALRYGNYSLEETSAPKGYKVGEPLAFAVTEGNKDPLKPITVVYEDDPVKGRISVQKLDAETNKEAGSGFVFSIAVKSDVKDAAGTIRKGTNKDGETVELVAGTVVDEITTNEKGLATSKELQLGEYTISEVKAGDYYSLGTVTVGATLTADKPDVTVKVANYKTTFELSKLDSLDTMKVLPGITFKLFNEKDISREKVEEYMQGLTAKRSELQAAMNDLINKNASEEEINNLREENQKKLEEYKAEYGLALDGIGTDLTTDNEGYIRLQNLHHSTRYYVTEIKTLDGYNLEPDIYSFDVDADGLVNGNRKYSMTITNTPNVLQITKTDATGEKELPGASLTLSKDGNTIESWISTEAPHVIKGLAPGTYKLEEIASPDGYCKAESIEFELTNTTEIQKVTMKDEYTTTEVSKLDSKTKNPVVGAKLALYKGEKLVTEWETNEKPFIIKGLATGDYVIKETFTPAGYATADPIKFTVTDELKTLELTMEDTPIKVVVSKNSTELGEDTELPGATLQILDSNDKEIDKWVTTAQPHTIEYLAVGDYKLRELSAPEGYSKAEDVAFSVTDTDKVQYVNMTDTYTRLEISKKTITGDDELPGAELIITNEDGEVVDTWTSTDKPHAINGLKVGTYKLEEVLAPDGYTTAEAIEFSVTDTLEVQKVEMKDAPTSVEISKKSITGDDELPGATLEIINSNDETVETWVSGDKPHLITGLPIGDYKLRETIAPDGYTTAEEIEFSVEDTVEIQKVEMKDAPTKVKISKVDITDGKELPGATLEIINSKGETVETWVSSDKPHLIEGLPIGDYKLRETTAPDGYTTAEEIQFSVKDTTKVQKVKMKDAPTKVEISKVDITDGKELPGATLEVKNSKDETIERWVSTEKPHLIKKLPIGDYTLTEITAPDGYEVAETIKFSVKDTTEIQKVVMKDKKKDTPATPTTPTSTPSVKTGDYTPIGLELIVMLAAVATLVAILLKRRTIK